jgi:hypothetical protein
MLCLRRPYQMDGHGVAMESCIVRGGHHSRVEGFDLIHVDELDVGADTP